MGSMSLGRLYADAQRRMIELLRTLSPEELSRKLPTTPLWSAKDVLAHVTGITADVLAGNVPTQNPDAWTATQVEARRHQDLEDIIAEWTSRLPAFEVFLDRAPWDESARIISDCYTHEHDVRGGTGHPGGRDAPALEVGLEFQTATLGQRLEAAGLPALRLKAGDGEWTAGTGEVGATVLAPSAFELSRCLMARRSTAQMASLAWECNEPKRYLEVFPRFTPPPEDIIE